MFVVIQRQNQKKEKRIMILNATFSNISVIVAVSFIDGENRNIQRKPPTCRKSLTTLSHNVVTSTPRHERNSN
jgi:hypothetical protein